MYTCLLLNHCLMIQQEFLALYKNTSKQKKKPSYTCRHYTKHFGIIVRARDWSPFGKIDLAV